MDDLISRGAAIDLVRDVCDAILSECGCHYDSEVEDEVYDDIHEVSTILKCNKEIRKSLKDLPSAQPDVPDTNVGDTISRQAAFEALCNAPSRCVDFDVCKKGSRYCAEGTKLDEVPSAQPDMSEYSDRLWGAAYERGKREAQPEVIRCKNCRWWDKYSETQGYCMAAKHGYYSSHWEIHIRRTYGEDFFCADAEPIKEEGEEHGLDR